MGSSYERSDTLLCKGLVTKEMSNPLMMLSIFGRFQNAGVMPVKIRKLFCFDPVSCYAAQAGLEPSMAFEVLSTSVWLY